LLTCHVKGGIQATSGDSQAGNVISCFPTVFVAAICLVSFMGAKQVLAQDVPDDDGAASPIAQSDIVPADIIAADIVPDVFPDEASRHYDSLIVQAREGNTQPALDYLRGLGTKASLDQRFDHILLASWAGLPDEVIAVYDGLLVTVGRELPLEVRIAVARSFRDLKKWGQSLDIWRGGLVQYAHEEVRFAPGLVMTLADSGQVEEALRQGRDWLVLYPDSQEMRQAYDYVDMMARQLHAERQEREAELKREAEARQYDALIMAARKGEPVPALEYLRGLGERATIEQRFDHILLASWAEQLDEVIKVYISLPVGVEQSLPANVQEVVARSFRDRKRFAEALVVWRDGVKQHEDKVLRFVPGLVLTLADVGRGQEAVATGLGYIKQYPNDADLHQALAYAYRVQQRAFDALHHSEQAFKIFPQNPVIEDEYIRDLIRAGRVEQALARVRHLPLARFSAAEVRGMEADAAARLTRRALEGTGLEADRFIYADRALARYDQLIASWSQLGAEAQSDLLRIRIDRLAALHARVRMEELVQDYENLRGQGVDVPVWALSNVASAYLYLRQPERSAEIYRQGLEHIAMTTPPEDREKLEVADARLGLEIGLFYALSEAEKFDEVALVIERLESYQTVWIYSEGSTTPVLNENYVAAQAAVVAALMAMDDTPAAQAKMEKLLTLAPDDAGLRARLAGIYRTRAQPRLALTQLERAEALEPDALSIALSKATVAMDLQEWQQAEALTTDLLARFPENRAVQRLARAWQVHNMAELRVSSGKDFSPDSPVNEAGDFRVDTALYSPPIGYNWRLFAGGGHAQGEYTEGNGSYDWLRAGVEWRSRDWWAEAEISAHNYTGGNKMGARFAFAHDLSDYWRVGGSVERFSRFSSVRALRSGIYADRLQAYVNWRAHERREWNLSGEGMYFSDGNDRFTLDLNGVERLYSAPHWRVDWLMNVSYQQNSKDDNRPYFNPKNGLMVLPSLRGTQILYRRYEKSLEHYATLSAGSYSQKYYDTDSVWMVEYGQRYRYNDVFEVGGAINHISRPYDGTREGEWRLRLDLTSRF